MVLGRDVQPLSNSNVVALAERNAVEQGAVAAKAA
jgi:hypothetical protein